MHCLWDELEGNGWHDRPHACMIDWKGNGEDTRADTELLVMWGMPCFKSSLLKLNLSL